MVFGIVLNRSGWRIDYLGISTPVEELTGTVDARHPDLVVLAATLPETLEPHTAQLTVLAGRAPLALAGPGATPRLAAAVNARLLGGDPVTAATRPARPRSPGRPPATGPPPRSRSAPWRRLLPGRAERAGRAR